MISPRTILLCSVQSTRCPAVAKRLSKPRTEEAWRGAKDRLVDIKENQGLVFVDTGIDIRELECLVYVVETNSFSQTAKCLHLSQPTVSAHILALERKVGMQLVVRGTKSVQPSDAGMILYSHAKSILQLHEKAHEAIRHFEQQKTDVIR